MQRSIVSLALGALMGLFLLSAAFATASILNPGWLRALAGPRAAPAPTQVVDTGGGMPATRGPAEEATPGVDAISPGSATPKPLPTLAGECGGPAQMTIALLGVDARDGSFSARTDAITLVRLNFANPSAAMLSIPRDLYVPLPGLEAYGIEQSRINTAFVYGEVYDVPGGGPAEFKETVALNFGIRVDRYVLVNFGAFTAAVDALGGIDVDVPVPIYDPRFPYDDDSGTFVFEVPAGRVHMDGATALRYVRTRHQDDDYQRLQRQQDVLLAVRERLLSPEVIPQIPGLIAALGNAGRTDLSPVEMASLACLGPKIDRADIQAYPIDGSMVLDWTTPGGSRVSIPNRDAIAPVVQAFLNTGSSLAQSQP